MRFREEFSLYKRTVRSGKIIWYYHAYDEDGSRISVSTGQKVKSRAREFAEETNQWFLFYWPKDLIEKILIYKSISSSIES